MSKLPIAAFYPNGSPSFSDAHNRSGMPQNRTIPAIILADSKDLPSPVTLCVDGVLLWLLLAWLTAGTAAIITLLIKSCRSRWNKHVDDEEFDWSGLEDSRSRSTKSQHTRSTSCSSAPSLRNVIPTPQPITTPSPNRSSRRSSSLHTSSRRNELDASRRHKNRSRRLQSTTA